MKKIFLLLLLLPLLAVAQSPANRAAKTVVADVLAQMPAKNVKIYDQYMADLLSCGDEGLNILMEAYQPNADNTASGYAIGGLSYFVTTPGKDEARQAVQKAVLNALEKSTDREVKAFFIRQLNIVGDNSALGAVMKYAANKELSQDAVNVIVTIGTHGAIEAAEAIFEKIPNRMVAAKMAGDLALSSKEAVLIGWLKDADVNLTKTIYYALSKAGTEKSVKILADAAAKANFKYDAADALTSYLTILGRYPDAKTLDNLIKSKDANVRIAAMNIIASTKGKAVLPYALRTMESPSREYRNGALAAAAPFADDVFYAKLAKYNNVDVIAFFGNQKAASQTAYLIKALQGENYAEAAVALGKIATPEATAALVAKMDNEAVCEVLTWYKPNIDKELTAAIGNENSRKAALKLIGARRVTSAFDKVVAMGENSEAIAALDKIATAQNFDVLADLFAKTPSLYEKAFASTIEQMPKDEALAKITKLIAKNETFFPALAIVNTPAAFAVVKKGINEGKNIAQLTALFWKGKEALPFIIAEFEAAPSDPLLGNYLRVVKDGGFNDVQRLIHLRKILDIAKSDNQRNQILKEIAKCNTFNSLIVAADYINNPATEQSAGNIVVAVIGKDKEYAYWGADTKALLQKFVKVRKGGDASYEITAINKYLAEAPAEAGYVKAFNGKNLDGWKGLVQNPVARRKMTPAQLAEAQKKADEVMAKEWFTKDGVLHFTGKGENICTAKDYGDFEMWVDWRIGKHGDSGIYLRGSPQVQIWDTTLTQVGAQVGSGGLYNNQKNPSKPLVLADNAIGDWNTFYVKMVGERVTVVLNGIKVVDNVILENYWDRNQPIFPVDQIELQAHGDAIAFRDIFIKELPAVKPFELTTQEKKEGYKVLFDGVSMHEWVGNTKDYVAENGTITLYPGNGGGGNLYSKDEYADFTLRFEFMLTPAANNGLGIRTPMQGDAAYVGTELQILDSEHPVYKDLYDYQYHGSAYGIIPAKRGFLKPVGEWNYQEVTVKGHHVTVTLNGEVILDGDMAKASKNGTAPMDGKEHPGLMNTKGHIGFLGHGSIVKFRNIRIKEL